MTTVQELIKKLEEFQSNLQVFIEFNGSINLNEIEVEDKELPDILYAQNGKRDIVVIKPKLK